MRANGAILWEGRSHFDGRPIIAIATGLARSSSNPKTGSMVQTWILPRWRAPHTAVASGSDSTVCGACPLRSGQGCYVRVGDAPLSVWRAYHRGRYAPIAEGAFDGRMIRVGSYGDPAALPITVWAELLEGTRSHTGYTHAWRTCDPAFKGILMASADDAQDRAQALEMGWRVFRSRLASEPVLARESVCPASEEGGHRTTCSACGLCDGSREGDRRSSVVIIAHGPTVRYATARASLRVIQHV